MSPGVLAQGRWLSIARWNAKKVLGATVGPFRSCPPASLPFRSQHARSLRVGTVGPGQEGACVEETRQERVELPGRQALVAAAQPGRPIPYAGEQLGLAVPDPLPKGELEDERAVETSVWP